MICRVLVGVLMLLVCSVEAHAQRSLTLDSVFESVRRTHPKAAQAEAKVDAARAGALSERGAFDPRLQAKGSLQPTGYYQHALAQVAVAQRIPGTGASVEGRHRWSGGDVQDYYGEKETLPGGEVSLRMVVPLLADRATDAERTAIEKADLGTQIALAGRDLALLELYRAAAAAYFEWVARAQLLDIAQNLLDIAELRAATIAEQVERGAIAGIQRVDAQRVLLARKSKVLEARGKFIKAQQKLSLYYRSELGQPQLASRARAPEVQPVLRALRGSEVEALIDAAVRRRPELIALEEERKRIQADLRLASNQRLPKLNLELFAARDLGSGDPSLGQTDTGLGLSFELPLGRRKATGKAKAARAKLAALEAEGRGLRDRIATEIRALASLSELRGEQAELATERWRATEVLADAERTRLVEGASDLLTVNLREKDVAAAAADAIESALERNKALAELYFVAGLLPRISGQGDRPQ